MDNEQIPYNAASMPIGTRSVSIYRQNAPVGTAPAFGGGGAINNCTLLGVYNLEMFGWKEGGKEIDRNTPTGADLDFAIVRGKITGSATAQLATGLTALLRIGDMFEISPGYKSDNATALPFCRFVVIDAGKDENEGAANKQSLTLRLDRTNSDPFWQS